MKTSELTGAALDWAVAKCEGYQPVYTDGRLEPVFRKGEEVEDTWPDYQSWAQGGPIIEREEICTKKQSPCSAGYEWNAWIWTKHIAKGGSSVGGSGTTPLIAAMRCFVSSKLGDDVEIPKKLTT